MSQSYRSYQPHTEAMTHQTYRHARHTVSPPQHHSRSAYTLAHGGRQVRIGPVAFWAVVGTLVIMGVWSLATGTYFAFRENVLTRLIGRQAEMQFAYEDRIAELRAQIDRITSRQLLDQEQFEQKLSQLLQRQSLLEQHTAAIANDVMTTGSIKREPVAAEPRATNKLKLSPLSDNSGGLENALTRVSLSLDNIEQRQTTLLSKIEEDAENKTHRIHDALADLGINMRKPFAQTGVGGPFIPLRAPRWGASEFERQLYRVNVARAQAQRYQQTLVSVPLRKPVTGEIDMSSTFGIRTDPFLGRPAMHSGLDLRGDIGEPVHATASGRVTFAGRDGGYGNMVEISHGNGLATRYGHLSAINVKVGEPVHIGQTIGKVGSTGRSTGPHLHYETRVNGEAVNPEKFLSAGVRLGKI